MNGMINDTDMSDYEIGVYNTYSHFRDNPEDLETFKSIQDYDPELHESEAYYENFPTELKEFCFSIDEDLGTEPSGEQVWEHIKTLGVDVAIDLVSNAAENYNSDEDVAPTKRAQLRM